MSAFNGDTILVISYVSIQFTITVIVSILGAYLVYQRRKYETKQTVSKNERISIELEPSETKDRTLDANSTHKCSDFYKLWAKTMWKMRSIYSSLAVHTFDVLTDVLVIVEWLNTPNIEGDNIDPQLMAYSAIAVILFSKILSSICIYVKERNIIRVILQFLDLLIFFEIIEAHRKIKSELKNVSKKDQKSVSIDGTLSFKYIRQMEAIFESVPQSILQLVFVMRTSTIETIFIISILQSIVSMTNSNLNHDHTRMLDAKWKKYKQKLPPTKEFLRHSICRLAEITHRIGLLSLIWTVCGGPIFSIVLGVEFLVKVISTEFLFQVEEIPQNMDSILLAITSLIIVPSEEMYSIPMLNLANNPQCNSWFLVMWIIGTCGGCFVLITIGIASISAICFDLNPLCFIPLSRMHLSFLEFIVLILYGLLGEHGEREIFLLLPKHGLGIFIVSLFFYSIWTQYLVLFPNFALPLNVNVRSKWGYAYGNELSELKKLKWNTSGVWNRFKNTNPIIEEEWQHHLKETAITDEALDIERERFCENWKSNQLDIDDLLRSFFWDEKHKGATAAIFALANENHEIVQWLEEQTAIFHKGITVHKSRKMLQHQDLETIGMDSDEVNVRQLLKTTDTLLDVIESDDEKEELI